MVLWQQRSQQDSNAKPKNKTSSIVLAAAAFLVFITILSIAGLALYMGALRNDVSNQLLTFSCSAKVLRGDRFITRLQDKARKYRQQLEVLYHKSSIGPALVSCVVDAFDNDTFTIRFKITLNKKKISRSIVNLEKLLRDILLNDSISRRPILRQVRFDPRSVHIKQILDNDNIHKKLVTNVKDNLRTKSGVFVKPHTIPNNTISTNFPVKSKTIIEETDFQEQGLPAIQGSFHISKTEADITHKKETTKYMTTSTQKPKISRKYTQPITTKIIKTGTTATSKKPTDSFMTTIETTTLKLLTESRVSTKNPVSVNTFSFTIYPHSINQEPWIPIQRTTEISYYNIKNPIQLELNPTISLTNREKQPIYTSFTNPSLLFHSIISETLGSTNMVGHPLPVNKISTVTESTLLEERKEPHYPETTESSIKIDNIDSKEIEQQKEQSEAFVEVETLKHVPGSINLKTNPHEDVSNFKSHWELLNGSLSSINDSKLYNALSKYASKEQEPNLNNNLKTSQLKSDISSIFSNLASSLKVVPPLDDFVLIFRSTSKPPTNAQLESEEIKQNGFENIYETNVGEGHAEVINVDDETLILEPHASTKIPLVTLIPVKSNSGIGRPLRPRPERPINITKVIENRSFPNDAFSKTINAPMEFLYTEVVTSVSTEINKIRLSKNQFDNFKTMGAFNFKTEKPYGNNEDDDQNNYKKSAIELVRNPKMDPKENFTTSAKLGDEVSVFSVNSSISVIKNERLRTKFNTLTENKLKQLSEISKLNTNITNGEETILISNKAISASHNTNQASFNLLTKTFNKIPQFLKDEERKTGIFVDKIECNNFTIKCGNGHCLPDTTRCNQLIDCNDGIDEQNCNCADYLRSQYLLRKICDGVVDCWDFSDENHCEWCKPDQYVCENSKLCIDRNKICDGFKDCPNDDDERQCVTIASTINVAEHFPYSSEGYLLVRKFGKWGKLCLQNLEQVITKLRPSWKLSDLGQAVCKIMTYREMDLIHGAFEPSHTNNNGEIFYEFSYASINMSKSNLSFKESTCESREVVKLKCKSLECGTRPQTINQLSRIVGGSNAGLGAWPWQAALYKEGEFQCGATLLSELWLLSAGHCFFHSMEDHWVARIGALRRGTALPSPYEQLRRIIQIVLHPRYVDVGFVNDISLLKLETPVVFSDYVRPICLPTQDSNLKDGRICTVIGWGQLFEVGRIFPDTLQEVQVPVISTEECRKLTLFLPLYKITDDMFCAGYERGGRDACLGDSGGPLMCSESNGHWILYGITSNGYGCARANRPGIYTKVSNYVTWINSYINNNNNDKNTDVTIKTCSGLRCPLGECLPKSRLCNGYIECSDGSDEKNCSISL